MNRVVFPNAKINLGLKVLNKREDGFHNLETIFLPIVTMTDILEISDTCTPQGEYLCGVEKIGKLSFKQSGIEAGLLSENLCVRAYELLDKYIGGKLPQMYIHLLKQVPIGAGLGGGSADASFTLATINESFGCGLSVEELRILSLELGSDCPFFIDNKPMLGQGRGEVLTPINFSLPEGYCIKVITPPVFVSTADAYKGIVPRDKRDNNFPDKAPLTELVKAPVAEWKNLIFNDFETTVFAKYPILADYKQSLYNSGAVYASMSGSGSSMFGIYPTSHTRA